MKENVLKKKNSATVVTDSITVRRLVAFFFNPLDSFGTPASNTTSDLSLCIPSCFPPTFILHTTSLMFFYLPPLLDPSF